MLQMKLNNQKARLMPRGGRRIGGIIDANYDTPSGKYEFDAYLGKNPLLTAILLRQGNDFVNDL